METLELLERTGYGSNFNSLYISKNIIIKQSKNEYGHKKLKKEILFYLFLEKNNIQFPRPKILSFTENSYTMEYLKEYIPLYSVFSSFTTGKKEEILLKIKNYLKNLHKNIIKVSNETFTKCLKEEFYTKLIERFTVTQEILVQFEKIKTINNKKIFGLEKNESVTNISFFTKIVTLLFNQIQKHFSNTSFSVIHGDCQFNNILINKVTEELVFIDPRGYFGSSDIYGMPEYDLAKIQFALSGYDIFDNMEMNTLDLYQENINIPLLFQDTNPLPNNNPITLFTLGIWMGNAHIFSQNSYKCAFSYFYALHLFTLYFESLE